MDEPKGEPERSDDSAWQRWRQKLSSACLMVLETFRGHSGMDDLKNRKR